MMPTHRRRQWFYWTANGAMVFALGRQLLGYAPSKFAYAYAIVLACGILPMLYALCAGLVFANFYIPALTTWAERGLMTSMELGLIIVLQRGRGNLLTFGIAAVMLFYQVRLLTS
jgi:hypothetical protein